MKIIFNEYEKEALAKAAKTYNVSAEGLEESLESKIDISFDDLLEDLLATEVDAIRKDYPQE